MKKRILIIDDDVDILEPLSILLKEEGYFVETMSKVDRNHQQIEKFKPDLILLDMLMSVNDGRVICTTLKNNPKIGKKPIFMMSAHPSAAKDAIVCGADGFIEKPFETEEMFTLVNNFL